MATNITATTTTAQAAARVLSFTDSETVVFAVMAQTGKNVHRTVWVTGASAAIEKAAEIFAANEGAVVRFATRH